MAPPSSSHQGGVFKGSGGGSWCRAACSNLVPVRSGSLIPDYGSLGLRDADAQLCVHLQATDLNLDPKAGQSRPLLSRKSGFHRRRLFAADASILAACTVNDTHNRSLNLRRPCLPEHRRHQEGKQIKADSPPLQGDKSPWRHKLHDRLKAKMAPKRAQTNEKLQAVAALSVISESPNLR